MENFFLSFPEKYQEYNPENEKYKAVSEEAKQKIKAFPKIKVSPKFIFKIEINFRSLTSLFGSDRCTRNTSICWKIDVRSMR